MSEPVLQANELTRHYAIKDGMFSPPKILKAVDGVSFSLVPGKTLAVVGESGCGKSTLGRLLTLIEPPTGGTFVLDGEPADIHDVGLVRRMRQTVQMIFQDPYGSLNPRKKVGTILEEPLIINTKMSKEDREAASRDMMTKVGLRPEHYNRYPHMFSGGQRQRIAIARALMLSPKVIVADEPVSALDVSIQAQVLNLLMDLQEDLGLAYLFISHDLSVVRHIANDVMVMYLGRPVEQGPNEAIFGKPIHPYTRALLASTPRVNPDDREERIVLTGELPSPLDPPSGCAFHKRCPFVQDRCRQEYPESREIEGRSVACHFAGEV
ncbi:MAG: ABC transporter ATP-binding protein [Rhodospirillales bacterium]|mgnify:CR=1 FL=1|jgi:dipeptide transport system ATP-binding protein|nr:ABC transporter ATP-binding protein [Rhodospirillales bacterium]